MTTAAHCFHLMAATMSLHGCSHCSKGLSPQGGQEAFLWPSSTTTCQQQATCSSPSAALLLLLLRQVKAALQFHLGTESNRQEDEVKLPGFILYLVMYSCWRWLSATTLPDMALCILIISTSETSFHCLPHSYLLRSKFFFFLGFHGAFVRGN